MSTTDTLSVELTFNVVFMYKQVRIIMLALMDSSLYELSAQTLKICREQLKDMTVNFQCTCRLKSHFSGLLSCYVHLCSISSNSSYICMCVGGQNKIKTSSYLQVETIPAESRELQKLLHE